MILAVASFWKVFSAVLFLLTCFLLIVVVLLQKGRGGGLSGAFGGAGGHSAFGAKTGDFLTWVTVGLAGLFLVIAIVNNYAFHKITVAAPAPPQPAQLPGGPAPGAGERDGGIDLSGEEPAPGQAQPEPPAVPGEASMPEGGESGGVPEQ